jgi:hypothetical protein
MPVSTEEVAVETPKKKASSSARPCFKCGVMMEPDEWVLVAGPRLLCRVCFHDEFKSESSDAEIGATADEPVAGEHDAGQGKSKTASPVWGKAIGYFIGAGVALAGSAYVILRWSFTWGFTPLAVGVLLIIVGIYQATQGESE